MFVKRTTMEAAVATERARYDNLVARCGSALQQTNALQSQLADWITEKGEQLTPEQFAALFYSQDDRWQAAFFNCMSTVVQARHDAMPSPLQREYRPHPGVPAGEGQWCWMAGHINDEGFATLEAMFEHAKSQRSKVAA